MTDLAVIPVAGTLGDYSDPAAFVELALTRAKEWLVEAIEHGDIAGIIELKSQAEAIRVYTTQKQIGKDAELNAAEIVRRAERGLGLAIRKGQAEGEIATQGVNGGRARQQHVYSELLPSPRTFVDANELSGNGAGIYQMTDGVPDETFEDAIDAGRIEQNLSRANIVRKIRGDVTGSDKLVVARQMASTGNTSRQIAARLGYSLGGMSNFLKRHDIDVPADRVIGRVQTLNSTRIVDGAIATINGIGMLFDQIAYADLPAENVQGWLEILNESIRSLTTLRNRLKEMSQP